MSVVLEFKSGIQRMTVCHQYMKDCNIKLQIKECNDG